MKDLFNFRREYKGDSLSETDISQDPIEQFKNWFKKAIKYERYDPNSMILSTTDSTGEVSSRVVLLKAYSNKGFTFFGNYQSKKGQQLSQIPKAGLLFYWPEISRQIRIEGTTHKLLSSESDEYFSTRPRGSQIAAHVSAQSREIKNRDVLEISYKKAIREMEGIKVPRPKNWGGWLLIPHCIEFWQGRENRLHDRIKYFISNKTWYHKRLSP